MDRRGRTRQAGPGAWPRRTWGAAAGADLDAVVGRRRQPLDDAAARQLRRRGRRRAQLGRDLIRGPGIEPDDVWRPVRVGSEGVHGLAVGADRDVAVGRVRGESREPAIREVEAEDRDAAGIVRREQDGAPVRRPERGGRPAIELGRQDPFRAGPEVDQDEIAPGGLLRRTVRRAPRGDRSTIGRERRFVVPAVAVGQHAPFAGRAVDEHEVIARGANDAPAPRRDDRRPVGGDVEVGLGQGRPGRPGQVVRLGERLLLVRRLHGEQAGLAWAQVVIPPADRIAVEQQGRYPGVLAGPLELAVRGEVGGAGMQRRQQGERAARGRGLHT